MFFTNPFVYEYHNKKIRKINKTDTKFTISFLKYMWVQGFKNLTITVKLKTGSKEIKYSLTKNFVYDAYQLDNEIQNACMIYELTHLIYIEFECS